MSLESIQNALPDYAKDIKLNLSGFMNETDMTEQQTWGTLFACALATGNEFVIREIESEAKARLSTEAFQGAKAAASIMAMNNVYYKFVGMIANEEYKTMPAKLRMNILASHGTDKIDFELWALAVSAMNGCKFCVDAHDKKLRDHGVSAVIVQTAVRMAAVIQATSATLAAESAMSSTPMAKAA
ncbi:MAG: carboxymuconolactone decarboxylase family protein [Alphaproteobacteria bacterium]|nr:carboxymuconolactone decarboxylase family protein [Alphaproteobacteria bacterium]